MKLLPFVTTYFFAIKNKTILVILVSPTYGVTKWTTKNRLKFHFKETFYHLNILNQNGNHNVLSNSLFYMYLDIDSIIWAKQEQRLPILFSYKL